MIVTIAEQFTSDPSDREQSQTIIWKPGVNSIFLNYVKNYLKSDDNMTNIYMIKLTEIVEIVDAELGQMHYLSPHSIIRITALTTKLRVSFNAFSKVNSRFSSLHNCIDVGLPLTPVIVVFYQDSEKGRLGLLLISSSLS